MVVQRRRRGESHATITRHTSDADGKKYVERRILLISRSLREISSKSWRKPTQTGGLAGSTVDKVFSQPIMSRRYLPPVPRRQTRPPRCTRCHLSRARRRPTNRSWPLVTESILHLRQDKVRIRSDYSKRLAKRRRHRNTALIKIRYGSSSFNSRFSSTFLIASLAMYVRWLTRLLLVLVLAPAWQSVEGWFGLSSRV